MYTWDPHVYEQCHVKKQSLHVRLIGLPAPEKYV